MQSSSQWLAAQSFDKEGHNMTGLAKLRIIYWSQLHNTNGKNLKMVSETLNRWQLQTVL